MLIRKRSFIEIFLPLTVLTFLGQGTRFIDITNIATLRFVFLFILFFYIFLNKKIFYCISNTTCLFLVFNYLIFCVSTTLWSQVPILSLEKSLIFMIAVITFMSVGCLWVVKFGFRRSLEWLLPVMIITLISGFFGGKANNSMGNILLYGGLSGNANNFGFLTVCSLPLLIWRCYCAKENKKLLFLWIIFLLADIKFLGSSYSRSSIANSLCIFLLFTLSLNFSKKILISIVSFISLAIVLTMLPAGFIESMVIKYVSKGAATLVQGKALTQVMHSRQSVWQKSYDNAKKGGILGGGFAVTIGDAHFNFSKQSYDGREKGNSQFAILEETGAIGLILAFLFIVMFYFYTIPYFMQLRGDHKVMMGLVIGLLSGLLVESLVEAWWDSLGPEVICFWMLVGVVFGNIFLIRKKISQTTSKDFM